ncbi:hypothetical protein N7495_009127 [Penicillium taxi]|uniref:uncharacterized protein n=1 Tax=Penicillium taxi TaxID=168475 RepID=UPI0025458823|nr:uncharacterized protein N7495_009127 [Penicillium taxi]KAJ5889086.1 hypothetical protein N7495_009127 [Penicillium taxi]
MSALRPSVWAKVSRPPRRPRVGRAGCLKRSFYHALSSFPAHIYSYSDVLLRHVKYMHDEVPAASANSKRTKSRTDSRTTPVNQTSLWDVHARAANPVSQDISSSMTDDIVPNNALMSNPHLSQVEFSSAFQFDKFISTSMLLAHDNPVAEQIIPRGTNGAGHSEHDSMNNAPSPLSDRPAVPQIDHHQLHPMANQSSEGHHRPTAQERHVDTPDYQRVSMINHESDNVSPRFHQIISGSETSSEERTNSIPAERFSLVSRLWPKRWSSQDCGFTCNLWKSLIMPSRNTAASDNLHPGSSMVSMNGSQNTDWGLDDSQQQELVREFAPKSPAQPQRSDSLSYATSHTTSRSYDGSSMPSDSGFPSTRLLNLGLSTVLRQTHCLVSFLHQPTFVVRAAPKSIIAIKKCCADLAEPNFGPDDSKRLVSNLSAATLLLYAVSLHPSKPHSSLPPIAELLGQAQANSPLQNEPVSDIDVQWKLWACVESMKRLVATLIVTDSWWSYKLGTTPLIFIHAMRYDLPCSTELFRSSSAKSWKRLIDTTACIDHPPVLIELHRPLLALPLAQQMSPIGMMGLLSIFWIRILEIRRRIIPQGPMEIEQGKRLIVPGAIYAKDESSKMIGHGLQKVYINYAQFLQYENPNCVTLWHFLNLQLLVNVETLESATGRYGLEHAHSALQIIALWSKTHYARRACLHAAGIFKAMNRRRITDSVMFHTEHTEVSVFLAALVLGLYIFTVHSNNDDKHDAERRKSVEVDAEPCEMLDDVDWPGLGLMGLVPLSETAIGDRRSDSPASRFIESESPLSFMGNSIDGGYDGAHMIFLEYANLLEDLNKGTIEGLSQVLRIMSNSLVDMDCTN